MTELNPNHRVTRGLHEHWHKIVAVVLFKYRHLLPIDVHISPEDIEAFAAKYPDGAVAAHDKRDGLHLRLVSAEEAAHLARPEGGLPS